MNWRAPALLLLLFALSAGAQAPQRLRVVTWNIHHGAGSDGKVDLARIAAVLKRLEPDLVALQEVDVGVRRSGKVDQPAELARSTGMKAVFAKNIEHQDGEYGNAILTRLLVVRHTNHPLPTTEGREQRGALEVVVAWPRKSKNPLQLRFVSTHFDHLRDDTDRLASAELLAKLAREWGDAVPTLVAGDFNARPKSATFERLLATWTRGTQGESPTYPAKEPDRQIDDVLYRPAQAFRVVEARVIDEAVASDHRPVLVVLEEAATPSSDR
jgi:endonuclease/exonuclease/phosphatase family metal-dependent hydrolase